MTAATFTLPAGARLATDNVGITTRADAVVVCDERDAWMLRAVLGLPDADQRGNTSRNQVEPRSSMPCQAASPVNTATNSSSLESKSGNSQSRTCAADQSVSTIQVVVNLRQ